MTRRFAAQHFLDLGDGRVTVKPKLKLCGDPSEADAQRSIITALTAHPRCVFVGRYNQGAFAGEYTRKDGKTTMRYVHFCRLYSRLAYDYIARNFSRYNEIATAKLKHSDIGGMLQGGKAFYMEVKKRGKKPDGGQSAFLDLVRENGGIAGVVYSVRDALELIDLEGQEM